MEVACLRCAVLAPLGLAAACAAQQPEVIGVRGAGAVTVADCFVVVTRRRMTLDQFAASAGRWRGKSVQLETDSNIPYRCLGPVIYALQRAGARSIGFPSELPDDEAQ